MVGQVSPLSRIARMVAAKWADPPVRQVVPRHGRHHGMAQAEGRRCLAHAGGLFGVGRVDDAAADVAEGTVAGAGVAEDEERGGLA